MTARKPAVAFVVPCVGRKALTPYPRSWLMEPLAMAVLSALTPPSFGRVLYDDRLENIPFDAPVDLAGIPWKPIRRGILSAPFDRHYSF